MNVGAPENGDVWISKRDPSSVSMGRSHKIVKESVLTRDWILEGRDVRQCGDQTLWITTVSRQNEREVRQHVRKEKDISLSFHNRTRRHI